MPAFSQFSRRSLALLAAAGAQLSGLITDDDAWQRISSALVPQMADWYVLAELPSGGSLQTLHCGHRDPAQQRWLAARVAAADQSAGPHSSLIGEAASNGKVTWLPSLHPVRDQAALGAMCGLTMADLTRIGTGSALCVPVCLGGRRGGALLLVRETPGAYCQEDLDVALEIARLLAAFICNVRTYQSACEGMLRADEVLAVAAHELRTPAATISGTAQLLLRQIGRGQLFTTEDIQIALGQMDGQSRRLGALVSRLLDGARVSSGKVDLELRETDLQQLLTRVADLALLGSAEHHLQLCAPHSVFASVDAVQIEQVLCNLLDNAFKFGPPGAEVQVSLSAIHGGIARLSVRDHGPGVPLERRERIFERYFQAHRDVRTGGLGLGLYFSRQIVELHGGRLFAEFPPDGGACFIVELPQLRPAFGPLPVASRHVPTL